MFKPTKEDMTPTRANSIWNYLVKWETRLKRNVLLCKIIQPLGTWLFTFNMLLATMNLLYMIPHESVPAALDKIPILPAMVKNFPRTDLKAALVFAFWFAFLIPLVISGCIFAVHLILDLREKKPIAPLQGTEAQCAKALAHQAEKDYQLSKKIPEWSIFTETTILTALTIWPILSVCLGFLKGDAPAILQIALGIFAMLVCLFVVFWIFAACFWVFSKINALYYFSPGQWKFWELFNEMDDYWESVDAQEYDRRERIAKAKKTKS